MQFYNNDVLSHKVWLGGLNKAASSLQCSAARGITPVWSAASSSSCASGAGHIPGTSSSGPQASSSLASGAGHIPATNCRDLHLAARGITPEWSAPAAAGPPELVTFRSWSLASGVKDITQTCARDFNLREC